MSRRYTELHPIAEDILPLIVPDALTRRLVSTRARREAEEEFAEIQENVRDNLYSKCRAQPTLDEVTANFTYGFVVDQVDSGEYITSEFIVGTLDPEGGTAVAEVVQGYADAGTEYREGGKTIIVNDYTYTGEEHLADHTRMYRNRVIIDPLTYDRILRSRGCTRGMRKELLIEKIQIDSNLSGDVFFYLYMKYTHMVMASMLGYKLYRMKVPKLNYNICRSPEVDIEDAEGVTRTCDSVDSQGIIIAEYPWLMEAAYSLYDDIIMMIDDM